MNDYIAELQENRGAEQATSNLVKQVQTQVSSLRHENTELKRKIAETEHLVDKIKRESETRIADAVKKAQN